MSKPLLGSGRLDRGRKRWKVKNNGSFSDYRSAKTRRLGYSHPPPRDCSVESYVLDARSTFVY